MESNLFESSVFESVEYTVDGDGNGCDIDLGGICGELQDGEQVVIKESRVLVVTPQSKSKKKDGDNGVSPEVGESVEPPCVGKLFGSWQEVEIEYKKYGKQQGFGISRVQGTLSKDKSHRRSMTWKCECWGDPEMSATRASKKRAREVEIGGCSSANEGLIRKRKSKKCNCTAMLYASMNNNVWEIKKVILEHKNHQPVPSQAKSVKEYRMQSLCSNVRRRLLNDTDCGVPVSKVYDCLARERGGVENMPYSEKDLRHVVDKERKLKMEKGDANAMLSYFESMKKQDANFFYEHRLVQETGGLKDVIWVDGRGRGRVAYEEFGDVVCFDTTYKTNEYELPFANFVGVNHHGQSILLGCALISNEDCDTFEWIFRQWLRCMKGCAPNAILTDQAAVMRRPLEDVMPNTRHRWCIWHILQKFPKKFGKDERYEEIKEEIFQAVYNSLTVAEFEASWDLAITKFSLHENKWLNKLYVERLMWVPAFMKGHFWAGMRTTQRVESMNSFFDKFIGRHTRLCEFGERYCAAVQRRVAQEKEADERDVKWIRKLSTGYLVEKVFRKVYTDNKYRQVQKECERIGYCVVREEKEVGTNKFFLMLEDRVWVLPKDYNEEVITNRRRMFRATYDAETKEVECDCKKFETHGILCHHVMRVFEHYYVDPIPEKYVIDRWRKDVIRKHSMISVAQFDLSKSEKAGRNETMFSVIDPMVEIASEHDEPTKIVVRGMKSILDEVNLWVQNNPEALGIVTPKAPSSKSPSEQGTAGAETGVNPTYADTQGSVVVVHDVKDPPIPQKRGRPKSNRFKAIGEPGWKKAKSNSKSRSKSNSDGNTRFTQVQEDSVHDKSVVERDDGERDDQALSNPKGKGKQKGTCKEASKAKKDEVDGKGKGKKTGKGAVVVDPLGGSNASKATKAEYQPKAVVLDPNSSKAKLQPKPRLKVMRQQKLEAFLTNQQDKSYLQPVVDELLTRNALSFENK